MNFVSRDFTERQIAALVEPDRVHRSVYAESDTVRHTAGAMRVLHNRCAYRDAEGVHEPVSVAF